jgi:hypothetical protein
MSKRTTLRTAAKTPVRRKKPTVIPQDETERSWQQMYILAERWKSDVVFFYDELNFFRKLVDKYFMSLIDEKYIDRTRQLASDLARFEKRRYTVSQRLALHLKELALLMQNPFAQNAQRCRDEHGEIEILFSEFTKEFRKVKAEVFDLTENVMASEKSRHLLNGNGK